MTENLNSFVKELRQLIMQAKSEKALKQIIEIAQEKEESDIENQAIATLARLRTLNNDKMGGLITSSAASIATNQINAALLYLVNQLEELQEEESTGVDDTSDVSGNNKIESIEEILEKEKEQLTKRFTALRERRNFVQEKLDIASDVSQIFSMKKEVENLQEEMDLIKEKLMKLSQ